MSLRRPFFVKSETIEQGAKMALKKIPLSPALRM